MFFFYLSLIFINEPSPEIRLTKIYSSRDIPFHIITECFERFKLWLPKPIPILYSLTIAIVIYHTTSSILYSNSLQSWITMTTWLVKFSVIYYCVITHSITYNTSFQTSHIIQHYRFYNYIFTITNFRVFYWT